MSVVHACVLALRLCREAFTKAKWRKPVTAGLALPPFDWLGAVATDNGAGAATGAAVRVYSMNATRWACDSDRCSYWRCRRRVS